MKVKGILFLINIKKKNVKLTFSVMARPGPGSVMRIRNMASFQCCGSMTFWGGSGSCYFRHWPSRCQQITNFLTQFFFFCLLRFFLKLHLYHFLKIKSQKESKNSRKQGFSYYFCMMIEGSGSWSRAGSGSGSIHLTSGSGSGRPKNMWIRIRIRIRNTASFFLKTKDRFWRAWPDRSMAGREGRRGVGASCSPWRCSRNSLAPPPFSRARRLFVPTPPVAAASTDSKIT